MTSNLRNCLISLVFWLTAFALYFKTSGAGFVTDQIGWLDNYKATGWRGLPNAFGDKSLHYFYHFTGFLLFKVFGLNGFAWMLFFVLLHAVTATLAFVVFNELYSCDEVRFPTAISFTGSLLFLVSPYHTEAMVWYACVHYLVCSLLLLLALSFFIRYLNQKRDKFIVGFYICCFLSLVTLEISFVFPLILFAFILFWPFGKFKKTSRQHLLMVFFLPSLLLLFGYFLASSLLRGSAVGHYGAEQHLNFDVPLLMGNLSKYCTKIFFLSQFLSFEKRSALYGFFEIGRYGWALFLLLSLLGVSFIFLNRKLNSTWRITLLVLIFFIIALLPILNLYFSFVVNVEGDRFTYFPSIFAYQFVAIVCFGVFRRFGWIPIFLFFFLNLKFLYLNTESWSRSGKIQSALIEKFEWHDASKIYLLNLPDNFRGTYMFRGFPPDNFFAQTLKLKKGKDITSKTVGVYEYNMLTPFDSVNVEKISDNQLKVSFSQNGNWWWGNGIGADDYSTQDFEVDIDQWGASYTLTLKNKTPGAVYLYQCGDSWREVKNF